MMEIILIVLIGYLFGSLPTAFILIKRTSGLDITQNGTGSVGAHNSFRVSKSKLIAAIVFTIDFLKGLLAVLLIKIVFGEQFLFEMICLISAVIAHCYSPWIKFKGGRGLATTAGGAIILSIPLLIIWAIIWLIAFVFRRNIHFANFSASLLTAALTFTSADILMKYTYVSPASELQFSLLVSVLFLIIISKHIIPIREYFSTQQNKIKDAKDEQI